MENGGLGTKGVAQITLEIGDRMLHFGSISSLLIDNQNLTTNHRFIMNIMIFLFMLSLLIY